MTVELGDLANEVMLGVERLSRRDELRTQIRSLDAVEQATDTLLQRLGTLEESLSAARQAGFAPAMPDISVALTRLGKLFQQLEAGEVDREFAQSAIDAVSDGLRAATESLTLAWRTHVSARVPSQEGLLVLAETFSAVQGASAYARDLQSATASVQALLRQRPTADAVEKLDELATAVPALVQELVGEEPEVREFADGLVQGGASIETLTPAVLNWMQEKGHTASFKVVPGRPAGRERK